MSSREIAGLTGKEHSNVMRDVRVLVAELQASNLNPVCLSTTYEGTNGQSYPQYELDKESTLTEQPASAKEPAAPDAQPRIAVDKRAIQCGAQLGKVLRLLPLRPGHAGAHADLRLLRAAGLVPFLLLVAVPLQDAG